MSFMKESSVQMAIRNKTKHKSKTRNRRARTRKETRKTKLKIVSQYKNEELKF